MQIKLCSIKIFKYQIPFIKPLKIFLHTLFERTGFIIEAIDQNNCHRLAEVAPLHLIGNELDKTYLQLIDSCIKLKKNEKINLKALYPCVSFGIWSVISKNPIKSLSTPYSGLLYHNFNLSKFKPSLGTYKVKLSNFALEDACMLVKKIKQKFPTLKLRLDINQGWTYSDAIYFLDHFIPDDFEYIEEPCKSIDETKKILKTTEHKIAIDESLAHWSFGELKHYKNIKALIIKPTLIDFSKYLGCNIPLVFSSSFETGVGLLNIAKLAITYSKKAPGLDTYRFLEHDVLKEPIEFGSRMRATFPINLNENVLKQCFAV